MALRRNIRRRPRRSVKPRRWRKPGMRRAVRRPGVYSYKRSVYVQAFATASNAGNAIAFAPLLSSLPGVTDFTTLYDQYMIKKVVFKLIPRGSEVPFATTTNLGFNIHSALDYDDSNVPTGPNDLLQYQSYKMTPAHRILTRVWTPRTNAGVINNSGTLVAAQPKAYQWLDIAQTNIPHFGLKMYIDATNTSSQVMPFDAVITYYVSFKGVR
jgi:hypothetical protein